MDELPTRFYRSISSYWRQRKYHSPEGSAAGKKTVRVARLGGGQRSGRRSWKLRRILRIRVNTLWPARLLGRLKDAYVDAMLWVAGRGTGLSVSASTGQTSLLARRIPRSRRIHAKQAEFEQRLIFEIYRSLLAQGETAAYLINRETPTATELL